VNEVDAVGELIAVLSGSEPFSGSSPLYGSVEFKPEYPLGVTEISTPIVAIGTAVGGGNKSLGLGTYERIGKPRLQIDVLAGTMLEARRIFQRAKQVILADYQDNDESGVIGKGYLRGKYIRSVIIGEPRSAPWDEQGRVKRVTADMVVEYLQDTG